MVEMRLIITTVLFYLTFFQLFAQQNKRGSVLIEFLGTSGLYSINYNRHFPLTPGLKGNISLGFGVLKAGEIRFKGIPLNFNVDCGLNKHLLNLGLGFTYIEGLQMAKLRYNNTAINYYTSGIYVSSSIKYKFDTQKKLYFLIGVVPLLKVAEFNDFTSFVNNKFAYQGNISVSEELYYDYLFSYFRYKPQKFYILPSLSMGYRL